MGQKETDKVFTERGVTFVIDEALFERVKPISIDYIQSALGPGYTLKSELVKGSDVARGTISECC